MEQCLSLLFIKDTRFHFPLFATEYTVSVFVSYSCETDFKCYGLLVSITTTVSMDTQHEQISNQGA